MLILEYLGLAGLANDGKLSNSTSDLFPSTSGKAGFNILFDSTSLLSPVSVTRNTLYSLSHWCDRGHSSELCLQSLAIIESTGCDLYRHVLSPR